MSLPSFDELVALAASDPEALEQLRREKVEEIIDSAGDADLQRRLRGLQFRIEAKIRQSRTPLAACISLSQMMHESLTELQAALHGQNPAGKEPSQGSARIYRLEQSRAPRTLQ